MNILKNEKIDNVNGLKSININVTDLIEREDPHGNYFVRLAIVMDGFAKVRSFTYSLNKHKNISFEDILDEAVSFAKEYKR